MIPAISWVIPPNINATPNTTGSTPGAIQLALTMLSMNVVTANAASASGAAFPHWVGSRRTAVISRAPTPSDGAWVGIADISKPLSSMYAHQILSVSITKVVGDRADAGGALSRVERNR